MRKQSSLSWVTVIVVLILFWPVGLYLLYKKLTEDRTTAFKKGTGLRITGWVFVGMGVVGVLATAGDPAMFEDLGLILFFLGGGILMLAAAAYIKKTGKRYRQYINLVINHNQTSVDTIASEMNLSYEKAAKDLQKMIHVGYFENAYLSTANREIVLPYRQQAEEFASANIDYLNYQSHSEYREPQKQKAVVCKNCGANNIAMVGIVGECEFCGSPVAVQE